MTTDPMPAYGVSGVSGDGSLGAVRGALLDRARQDAQVEDAAARARAEAMIGEAREQAASLVADARAQGEADAAAALGGEQSRTLREAHGRVLRAQREAYVELRRRSVAAVVTLLRELTPEVREGLEREAGDRLGPGAVVRDGADGPRAELGLRRLVLEPEHLVDLALAGVGPDLDGLWSP